MPEFVSRMIRTIEPVDDNSLSRINFTYGYPDEQKSPKPLLLKPYKADLSMVSDDTFRYGYERIAKIHNNFPVERYSSPSTVAFMDPTTLNIAMPSPERTPYASGDHVLLHEIQHVYAAIAREDHDERGFNDRAVDILRGKSGYDRFPFSSY